MLKKRWFFRPNISYIDDNITFSLGIFFAFLLSIIKPTCRSNINLMTNLQDFLDFIWMWYVHRVRFLPYSIIDTILWPKRSHNAFLFYRGSFLKLKQIWSKSFPLVFPKVFPLSFIIRRLCKKLSMKYKKKACYHAYNQLSSVPCENLLKNCL